jgi:hypothetical protein
MFLDAFGALPLDWGWSDFITAVVWVFYEMVPEVLIAFELIIAGKAFERMSLTAHLRPC